MSIADNLVTTWQAIDSAKQRCGRSPDLVELLAVSKGQSVHKIKEAIFAGQKKFGENYLQEALPKIDELHTFKLEWHFIGTIQRNKTQTIAENFTWVHSIERKEIAKRLSEQRPLDLGPLLVCLQVNLTDKPKKNGISPDEIVELANYVSHLPNITLRGLMTILPPIEDVIKQKDLFQRLRELKNNLVSQGIYLDTLSMGMSHDFPAAITAGATIVRIGSTIFGERSKNRA